MKRNRIATALAASCLVVAIVGCKREAEAPTPVAAEAVAEDTASAVISEVDHGSPASAAPGFDAKAFAGTYGGILACADCPGIDTTIAFTPEGGYTLSEVYQDGEASSFVTRGTWTVKEDGKTLLLDPEDKEEFDRWYQLASPTELRAMDREGKAIAGRPEHSLKRR